MLHGFREVKCQYGFTIVIWNYTFMLIIFNLSQWSNGYQIRLQSRCCEIVSQGGYYELALKFWYCQPFVKNNVRIAGGRGWGRRPNVVILECFTCWWESGEMGRCEMWEGDEVAMWEKLEGNEVARWERWDGNEVAR